MEKIDLFEKLVRFLAVKPLKDSSFCMDKARDIIKEESIDDINFIAQHGYFEDVLDTVEKRIGNLQLSSGTLYVYIKGDSSKARIEKNLLNLVLYVDKIYIIGRSEDWAFSDPKIEFLDIGDSFAENHQRFLISNSPSYAVALTARHSPCTDGSEKIEAALTNKKEAVSYLNQVLAPLSYKKQF